MSSSFCEIEAKVSDQRGSYQGLEQEALLTSEDDFRSIFEAMPEIKKWIEPGSGHGLGPLLFGELHPSQSAIGIEFEKSRYEASESKRVVKKLSNVSFHHVDLLSSELPQGDAYFFYFPTGPVLDYLLHQLASQESFTIIAIESHGDLLPRLRKESWLKEIKHIPLKASRHHPFAVVFEKKEEKGSLSGLYSHSFKQNFLTIQDSSGEEWMGESYGLEWLRGEEYQLFNPPRTIFEHQVKLIQSLREVHVRFHPALELRQLGSLKIVTDKQQYQGFLRKIFVAPSFKVEISSGEQVEWSEIRKIFWENTLCYDSLLDYYCFPHVV